MVIDDLDDDKKKKKMKNEKVDRINKTIANLKSTPFKKNIMTEAKDLFYDEKFDTNLNTDPWLIAFNNGVYGQGLGWFFGHARTMSHPRVAVNR